MRPIFIYRYERTLMQKSREFVSMFMKHGEELQDDFINHEVYEDAAAVV